MTFRPLVAALAVAGAVFAAPATAASTFLGTLGTSDSGFGSMFLRFAGFGSSLGNFTDYYTFNLAGHSGAAGGIIDFEFGSPNLTLNSVSLSGGTLSSALTDTSPASFSFGGLGNGAYQLAVSGRLTDRGWGGIAGYQGSIHAVASAAPEPETIAMLVAGLGVIGAIARRRQRR